MKALLRIRLSFLFGIGRLNFPETFVHQIEITYSFCSNIKEKRAFGYYINLTMNPNPFQNGGLCDSDQLGRKFVLV